MATPTIVLTHGRDQRWQIGLTMQREWTEALREGLRRVGAPYWETIDVRFAFYGDLWRDDVEAERSDDVSPIQDEFARELLTLRGDADTRDGMDDRSLFSTLTALAGFVDQHVAIGGEIVLQLFLQDLAQYFRDAKRRSQANSVVAREVKAAKGDVILLGHSMGTIVSYLAQFEQRAALRRVRGFLTFGSPLGMDSVRSHCAKIVPGLPFPDRPTRWVNIYNDEDFATMVPLLAPIFRAGDGRVVEDAKAKGRPPSVRTPGLGHDPLIYLSSRGLAEHLRSIIDGEPPSADAALAGERSAPPWLDDVDAEPKGLHGADDGERGATALRVDVAADYLVATDDVADADAAITRGVDIETLERVTARPGPRASGTTRRSRTARAMPPAPAGPTFVDRTLSADFPPVVAPGSERALLIAIAGKAVFGGGESTIKIERREGEQHVKLRIGVYAPDFDVTDAAGEAVSVASVVLDLDDPTDRVDTRFLLRAPGVKRATDSSIWISVSRGTLPIGQMELKTRIDPAYVAPSGEIKLSFSAALDPDIVLIVADRSVDTAGKGPFDLRVSREGQFVDRTLGQLRVTANAWNTARDTLEKYRQVNRLKTKKERIEKATAIGVDLWWKLPDEFHDFYWEELHDGSARSIAVYSQEPYIPWELIVPQRRKGGRTEPMLGIKYSIARWKQGRHFPDPLVVTGMSVIAPEYAVGALPEAAKEAQDLVAGYGARAVMGTRASVGRLLRSRGTQVIHFAGHGSYDPANVDDSEIRLADGPFVPNDLFRASIGRNERPFVFLNACQVGETGWDLTQIGGWADAFCDVGFSGFVGPYWKVNDLVARKAARLFYGALRQNQTVGEAMQAVRQRFLDDDEYAGHTSWLAYSLHCQPNVHIQLPGA